MEKVGPGCFRKLEAVVCRFCGHKFDAAEVRVKTLAASEEFENKVKLFDLPAHRHAGRPCPIYNSVNTITVEETLGHALWECHQCGKV